MVFAHQLAWSLSFILYLISYFVLFLSIFGVLCSPILIVKPVVLGWLQAFPSLCLFLHLTLVAVFMSVSSVDSAVREGDSDDGVGLKAFSDQDEWR